MSAKRRQETLEAFCVPIVHDSDETAVADPIPIAPVSEVQPIRRSARSSRRDQASARESHQDTEVTIESDGDVDFMPGMEVDSDDGAGGARAQSKKGKGKGKCKTATRSHLTPLRDASITNGVNPKVMLISLKAGALGLNLTVANNVYLWVLPGIYLDYADLDWIGWIRELRCGESRDFQFMSLYYRWWQEGIESQAIDRCNR
jgi:SWI/SNF-related matrix-associated actin-dependent regulator of chromatin subfamily A3